MKKQFLFTFILFGIGNFCFSQISMGKIEQAKISESKIKAPTYDSLETFIEYGSYYNYSVPNNERCTKSEFYSRYIGLQLYYSMFKNNYSADEIIIFKKTGTTNLLAWSDIGEKYFTIQKIQSSFEKSEFFNDIKAIRKDIPNSLTDGLLFELRDNINNETIYVVEPSFNTKFILTAYYSTINKIINSNTYIALKDVSVRKVPLSDNVVLVEQNTEWKGELTLLRQKDLWGTDDQSSEAQDVKFMVILIREPDTIIVNLHSKDQPESLENLFIAKNDFKKQKQQAQNEEKHKIDKLTQKYGEKYGKLINQGQVSIGMTKEMCVVSWGPTLNRRKYTDSSGEIEVWNYLGIGKLYFSNGKLNNIIRY